MGVLTDFVIADLADAQKVCDTSCQYQGFAGFAGLDADGMDTVKLSSLHAILNSEGVSSSMHHTVCSGGEEGPWVFEVPPDLVQRLAALSVQQLEVVIPQWAATKEFSPEYDPWSLEEGQEVLKVLVPLCKRAVTQGKSVLMWMCL